MEKKPTATLKFCGFKKTIFVQKKDKEKAIYMRNLLLCIFHLSNRCNVDLFALSLSLFIHFLAEFICCIKITYYVFLTTDYFRVSQTEYGGKNLNSFL